MGYSSSHPRDLVAIVLITAQLLGNVYQTDSHPTNCCTVRVISFLDFMLGGSDYQYCATFDRSKCNGTPSPPPPPPPPPATPAPSPATPAPPSTDGGTCRALDDKGLDCIKAQGCRYICSDRHCDQANNYKNVGHCPEKDGCCCSQYCADVKTCKQNGCEYDVPDWNCRKGPLRCFDWLFDPKECIREGFYINGGILCYASANETCENTIRRVITAVNFNGKEDFTSESDGITYVPHPRVEVDDPHNLIHTVGETTAPITGILPSDTPLYGTYVLGNGTDQTHGGFCATYTIKVERDGQYLITVKLMEPQYDARGKRYFSILLNEILVAPEIDLFHYAQAKNKGFDLHIKFSLSKQRSELNLVGFPTIYPLPNEVIEEMKLSFCRGTINVDMDFAIGGFSVVEIGMVDCGTFSNDICKCVDHRHCEYDSLNEVCVEARSCSLILDPGTDECRRSKTYYALGSQLCKNDVEKGECKDVEMGWALNLNGPTYADSRGVLYHGEEVFIDWVKDEDNIRLNVSLNESCPEVFGVTEPDAKNLYTTVVTAVPEEPGECISYPLPICKDGRYELAIKTVEYLDLQKGARRFNVKINNIPVLVEVDLMKLNRKCEPTEFIILFEVDHSGKTLRIEGQVEDSLDQPDLELQLCYGGGPENNPCDPPPDHGAFPISAYSVMRLGPVKTDTPGECLEKTNACECKHHNCEFNTVEGKCMERRYQCALCDFEPDECRRAGSWYANAAVLCKNVHDRGNCGLDKRIFGVNMGGMQHTGRKGIVHKSYTSVPPTKPDIGQDWNSTDGSQLKDIPTQDIALYETFGIGSPPKQGVDRVGKCAGYDVPIRLNGNYELSIKVGDYFNHHLQKRSINYKLNGVRLVHELDVRAHTKTRHHGMELNINFKVTGAGEFLHLKGHPVTPIVEKKISLEFCYGECLNHGFIDDTWIVSSWSIVKFQDNPDGENECGSGDQGTAPHPCSAHFEKPCECKKAGCEYNVVTKQCVLGGRACEHCETNVRLFECRRKDSFYVTAGVVCRNSKERGNCEFNETVVAVNFATDEYTDNEGVVYKSYLNSEGVIPPGTSVGPKAPINFGPGVDPVDKALYETYVFANPEKPHSKKCLRYNIRFKGDGEYEFSAKLLEYEFAQPGKRSFIIKLNGVVIVKELDIVLLTGQEQNVMNLVMNFNVTNHRRTLMLPGYPHTRIYNGKVIVEFCNGACNGLSPLWTLTAFSVLRFGTPENVNDTCNKFNDNLCECVRSLCQFKSSTGKCVRTPPFINYYGTEEDCRRENAYYSDGGIISRNLHSIGNCHELKTVFGVNLNGITYSSSDGIQYEGENELDPGMIKDPHEMRQQFELSCDAIIDASAEDAKVLYKTVTGFEGTNEKEKREKCFSYTIPLCADGRYELLIKSLVDDLSKNSSKRMKIRFGGHEVFREIDLNQLSGRRCKAVELVVLFELDNESSLLRVQGFPNTNITSSNTTLEFCNSECERDSFQLSAFAISRIEDPVGGTKDSCGTHKDSCSCVKGLCNYQSGSKKCTKRKLSCPVCDYSLPTRGECRRSDSYYIDGTGSCRNAHDRGDCGVGEVIKAVNMNGDEVTSSIGIKHEPFVSAKPDLNGDNLKMATDNFDDSTVPEEDRALYQSFVYSEEIDSPCMTYNVQIPADGRYELAVKTWDNSNSETGKRTMSIRLNGVTIVQDMDLVFIAGPRIAVNLITNFEVAGSIGGLQIAGFEDSTIMNDTISLEICHGTCRPNLGWILSAFSIIRFGSDDTKDTGIGCSKPNATDETCPVFDTDACQCRNSGCEYNAVNDKCIAGQLDCAICDKNPTGTECRRPHAFYTEAGVVCKNQLERGECTYSETILAVTFGKEELTDSRGVVYRPFSDIQPSVIPTGSLTGDSKNILTEPEVPPEDKRLYHGFIFGNPRKPAAKACLTYNVTLEKGGEYELSMRIFEYINNLPGKRTFDIKINGMVVIRALDIILLVGRMQNALHLIFNFGVDETLKTIRVPGFPPSPLVNAGELTFELCNGVCTGKNRIWTLSAFSIMKFEKKLA